MHRLIQIAYSHQAYYPGYGFHRGYGSGSWITNMVMSALVHSLIYGLVFRAMRHLTLPEAVLLVGAGIILVYTWSRARERRW